MPDMCFMVMINFSDYIAEFTGSLKILNYTLIAETSYIQTAVTNCSGACLVSYLSAEQTMYQTSIIHHDRILSEFYHDAPVREAFNLFSYQGPFISFPFELQTTFW